MTEYAADFDMKTFSLKIEAQTYHAVMESKKIKKKAQKESNTEHAAL